MNTLIHRNFQYFCLSIFKVMCYRCVVNVWERVKEMYYLQRSVKVSKTLFRKIKYKQVKRWLISDFSYVAESTINSLKERLAAGSMMKETIKGAPMKVRRT